MKKLLSLFLVFIFSFSNITFLNANKNEVLPNIYDLIEWGLADDFYILEHTNYFVVLRITSDSIALTLTYDFYNNYVIIVSEVFNPLSRTLQVTFEDSFLLQLDIDNDFKPLNDINLIRTYQTDGYFIEERAVITLGTILGAAALNALIRLLLTVVIGGVTFAVASSITDDLSRRTYNHFMAVLRDGQLLIGPSITLTAAQTRLRNTAIPRSERNVWSRNHALARTVAGTGAIWDPAHVNNGSPSDIFFNHFHPVPRSNNNGHSFYGTGFAGTRAW
ncbi:MAG: hypothetical protein FWF50_06185 [Defluviitaleaceae bacterium]|nr:hypothetical protein [Defluviitaleaceae bacterium]